ncbi:MAG: hypothetical protein Q9195_000429 [Heterodermia aff. obscurata]
MASDSPTSTAESETSEAGSGSQSSSLCPDDMDDIKDKIAEYLDTLGEGTFAASGSITNAVNPGLYLEGLGKIGLPLSERDAEEIINLGRQAPFGKGTETLVDTSVRKTWEINADRIQFRNPQWSRILGNVISTTVEHLGVLGGRSSVRADLHKLLLYEQGGFFKVHRDTEKVPKMFATLVIMLLSEHEGGEVIVQLKDRKTTLAPLGSNEFSYKFLAWYADVNHSVEPVTSGYRLVLTYNLIHVSNSLEESRPESITTNQQGLINTALKDWKKLVSGGVNDQHQLIYVLEHEYSERNFKLDSMKGPDQSRSLQLRDACQEHGFHVFLAHFEHSRPEDACEEDGEFEWSLTTIFTLDGSVVARDKAIEKEDIVRKDLFDDESPDEEQEDHEAWTGNEGGTITQIYRRSCLVVVPDERLSSFFGDAHTVHLESWIQTLLCRADEPEHAPRAKQELLRIASLISDGQGKERKSVAAKKPRKGYFQAEAKDVPRLMMEIKKGPNTGSQLLKSILPVCQTAIRNLDFVTSITQVVRETTLSFSQTTVETFVQTIVDTLSHELTNHVTSKDKDNSKAADFQPPKVSKVSYIIETALRPIQPEPLATLIHHCETLDLSNGVLKLLDPLQAICRHPGPGDLPNLLVPFVRALSTFTSSSTQKTQLYQPLVQSILHSYLQTHVGAKPTKPPTWSRPPREYRFPSTSYDIDSRHRNGPCTDCLSLDAFLLSPTQTEWRL